MKEGYILKVKPEVMSYQCSWHDAVINVLGRPEWRLGEGEHNTLSLKFVVSELL